MAKNRNNRPVIELLETAIENIHRHGVAAITGADALQVAADCLKAEPAACREDCRWKRERRPQKCACCARNYRNMKDCYER